ncbi:MAG: DUF5719 family protein [Nocardioides sp.]
MRTQGRRTRTPDGPHRQRTRRLDVTTILAVVLPLVAVGGLAIVRPDEANVVDHPPTLTRLSSATLVCPSGLPGAASVSVGSTAKGAARGAITVRSGSGSERDLTLRGGRVADAPSVRGAAVVRGRDALAPGLLAGRFGPGRLSGLECPNPSPDQWFTGVGARADHGSVVELTNPDAGPAIADITLLARSRTLVTSRLRGITVPGGKTISIDLGAKSPRRPELTAHVVVSRGRLGVHVLDQHVDLLSKKRISEWLPPQLVPARTNDLIGLPPGPGRRTVEVANGGRNVVRASVQVVTGETTFHPAKLPDLPVPAGTTRTLDVTAALAKSLADGAVGLRVTADQPVTATLSSVYSGDRVLTAADTDVTATTGVLLPPTGKRTLLLSAAAAGVAHLRAFTATGSALRLPDVEVQKGRTVSVAVPRSARLVEVTPERTSVRGAVLVAGDGAVVLPLRALLVNGLVPAVRPGRS